MHALAKKTIAIASAVGVGGVSSLFFAAAPASAIPDCANGGTLVSGTHICELTLTYNSADASPGTYTFQATSDMTQLQVLLVGGGGNGNYGHGGGGGGSVKIVDFDGGAAPNLNIQVGSWGNSSTVNVGTKTATAAYGTFDVAETSNVVKGKTVTTNGKSGVSGNGHAGYHEGSSEYGGGGGANGTPTHHRDGGAGKVADKVTYKTISGTTVTPQYPLFAGDNTCYGGGGAVGDGTKDGVATCGGGSVASGDTIIDPGANSGGGGGALMASTGVELGATGVVIVRWNATPAVKLSFDDGKRGHDPKTEHLFVGDTPTVPTKPKVSGYTFDLWYTDAAFTTLANFTTPIAATETFYGQFTKK